MSNLPDARLAFTKLDELARAGKKKPGTSAKAPNRNWMSNSNTALPAQGKKFATMVFEFLKRVQQDDELPRCAAKTAIYLSRQFNEINGGAAWPSLQTIARETRTNKTTVLRALRAMEQRGHLRIEWGKRGRVVSRYWIGTSEVPKPNERYHNGTSEVPLTHPRGTVAVPDSTSYPLESHSTARAPAGFERQRSPLPANWRPSKADLAHAQERRCDPDFIVDRMRRDGDESSDWSDTFRRYCVVTAMRRSAA